MSSKRRKSPARSTTDRTAKSADQPASADDLEGAIRGVIELFTDARKVVSGAKKWGKRLGLTT
jgi:hypothetical protein